MPLNIEVTQFPNGIGTARDNSVLSSLPLPGPNVALQIEDFDMASNFDNIWSVANIAAGAALATPLSVNGVYEYTTAGASGDGIEAYATAGASQTDIFQLTVGSEAWYGCRFMVDDPVELTLILGFVPDGSALAPADGMYFLSADGSAEISVVVENNATAQSSTSLGTLEANTWYEAILYWDGIDKVTAQFVGPDGVVGGGGTVLPGANLPAVGLEPALILAAGEAAAKVVSFDWVLFGGSR